MNPQRILLAASVTIALIVAGAGYAYYSLYTTQRSEAARYAADRQTFSTRVAELETELAMLRDERDTLESTLAAEKRKNDSFENQIGSIQKTVGNLEKLQATDAELLMKYSKVYFLSEHYIPEDLGVIPSGYRYPEDRLLRAHADALPFLIKLLKEAEEDGVPIRVVSAYRSFGEQSSLKARYTVSYGSGANRFSADQGYSEHQLGTTFDLTTPALGSSFTSFASTEAYTWLKENAHRFGFILSYPENNGYYQFEPWHWRFVGTRLAKELYESGRSLYDLEQREIDEYLLYLFD